MVAMTTSNLSMKLLIDTKASKVLFAEGGKDVVDFIFSILSLPVGTLVRLLEKEGTVGTLANIYQSIEDLNDTYLQPNQKKDTLLMPKFADSVTDVPLLLPNVESTTENILYRCNRTSYSNCRSYVSVHPRVACPECNNPMEARASYVEKPNNGSSSSEGGFVKGVVTYMIMDNLAVKPMSTISCVTILNKFNVKDVGALEEKEVTLPVDEGLKLLMASLLSSNALTDVFLAQKEGVRIIEKVSEGPASEAVVHQAGTSISCIGGAPSSSSCSGAFEVSRVRLLQYLAQLDDTLVDCSDGWPADIDLVECLVKEMRSYVCDMTACFHSLFDILEKKQMYK